MGQPIASVTAALEPLSCGRCGIQFAVPDWWLHERRDKGAADRTFYCPNGHCRVFCESELDLVKRELAAAKSTIEWHRHRAERSDRQLTRLRKRIERGVCPECNRSFQNLRRHRETKHSHLGLPPPRRTRED
jgi:hypothetical protein